jgi:2-polyprenyl-3-methyl-5-hydroxy-6-metoxy-1,4-benzoquinol methylase
MTKERFTEVYKNNSWDNIESKSGLGSTLQNSKNDRIMLKEYIENNFNKNKTIKLIDIPCGDFNWMNIFLKEMKNIGYNINYNGYDIVDEIINHNKLNYLSYNFYQKDIVEEEIPNGDILLCRDLLNHLPENDNKKILKNIINSNCDHIFISNNRTKDFYGIITQRVINHPNFNPILGSSRHLNIEIEPYNWPKAKSFNGHLGLWKINDLK